VVEHAIEHHLQAVRMRIVHQRLQVLLRAELRRQLAVVERVVLVVGVGQVDRVEVEHVGAEPVDVAELAARALQVAAPEVDFVRPHLHVGQVGPALGCLAPRAQHFGAG
jgi:hypothetical protein